MFKNDKNLINASVEAKEEPNATPVANEQEQKEKKKGSRVLKIILVILLIIFIIILLLRGCSYRYYTPTRVFNKVDKDITQERIVEEDVDIPILPSTPSRQNDEDKTNRVFLYANSLTASASDEVVNFVVKNLDEANQDIVAEIYVKGEELGQKEDVCIARSGAIEPGYQVSTINRIELEKGISLPAGQYKALLKENYYSRETGELANIDGTLEITLVVK